MKLGMIGLGKMGSYMAQRLVKGGHQVIGFDPRAEARQALEAAGGGAAESLQALVAALPRPRALWMMVPAGDITEATVRTLLSLLAADDIVVDGGNSNYKDSQRRAALFKDNGIAMVDCGTSGGVWGLAEGYSMMIGGETSATDALRSVFETLAPSPTTGWGRVGPPGAGHYTKMIHNGIEYGLMQSYAEGFSILKHKTDFSLDLHQVADIWRTGSVVRSWLLDLTANALSDNPEMDGIAAFVADSGEGRWTVAEAIELNVPAPVITASLISRLRSRDDDSYADKLLSAMRNQFGGHAVKKQ